MKNLHHIFSIVLLIAFIPSLHAGDIFLFHTLDKKRPYLFMFEKSVKSTNSSVIVMAESFSSEIEKDKVSFKLKNVVNYHVSFRGNDNNGEAGISCARNIRKYTDLDAMVHFGTQSISITNFSENSFPRESSQSFLNKF